MKTYLTITTLCIGLTTTLLAQEKNTGGPQYFPMPSTGGTQLPYSEAVKLGDTLYVLSLIHI